MLSRASKRPRDPNLLARSVVEDLIGEKMDRTPLEKAARRQAELRSDGSVEAGSVQRWQGESGSAVCPKVEDDRQEGGQGAMG